MYLTIRIDKENNRFYTRHNGKNYELRYTPVSAKVYELDFITAGEDKEVEEELLYTAFLFAQKEGIKIIPKCEKASKYLGRHKEFSCVAYQEQIMSIDSKLYL